MTKTWKSAIGALLCVIALVGCEDIASRSSGEFGPDAQRSGIGAKAKALFSGERRAGVAPGSLQRGDDTFINPDAFKSKKTSQAIVVPADGQRVELSLLNASIEAAAQAVLGDTLKLNYVVSDRLEGSVTIQTTGPIPKSALLELFEAALAANGATLQKEGQIVRIVPGRSGSRMFKLAGSGQVDGSSIVVAPLEFVSPAEMVNLMQPLIDEGLNVVTDKNRNLLMMSGTTASLEAGLDALNLFDVDVLKGKSVALVALKSAEPEDIVDELNKIFQSEENGSLNGLIEFVPNQRLGSVLIITSKSKYLDRARRWIRELDQSAAGSNLYLQTYDLRNRSAAEIAPILNQLLDGGESGPENTATEESSDGEGSSSSGVSGNAKVAADTSRNALIVRARREEHAEIVNLLRNLDSAARQVLLEATIAEVTLNEEVDVGVRWFFDSSKWDFQFSDLASGGVGGTSPGFSAIFGSDGAQVALSALASVTDVNVISSPTLLVVDNKEGILQIGDQVPIATQTSSGTTTDATVLTQVEYRDTGIILKVKPRVGAGGRVNLEIEQEVSDVAATRTSGIDSPTISQRKVKTSAVLSDGQTLALGGLVTENDNRTRAEVPGLGRVPVLGALFGARNNSKKRTELLIMIRPRVIYNDNEAGSVTQYWRAKLSAADSILKTGLGSPRHTVQEVLR